MCLRRNVFKRKTTTADDARLLQNREFLVSKKISSTQCKEMLVFAVSIQSSVRVRREWRGLTHDEQLKALETMRVAYDRGYLYEAARLHCSCRSRFMIYAHTHNPFLAHRALVWEFEEAVRRVDPTFTVPYWDFLDDDPADPRDFMQMTGGRTTNCVRLGLNRSLPCSLEEWEDDPGGARRLVRTAAIRNYKPRAEFMKHTMMGTLAQMLKPMYDRMSELPIVVIIACTDGTSHNNIGGSMGKGGVDWSCSDEDEAVVEGLYGDPILFLNHAMVDMVSEYMFNESGMSREWLLDAVDYAAHKSYVPVYRNITRHTKIPDTHVSSHDMLFNHPVLYERPRWWDARFDSSTSDVNSFYSRCFSNMARHLAFDTGFTWKLRNQWGLGRFEDLPCTNSMKMNGKPCGLERKHPIYSK